MIEEHEAIHGWFGLSYASYMVLNRTVLQSMPDEWQQRFVGCLRELEVAARDLPSPAYNVQVLAREPHLINPECGECEGTGNCPATWSGGVEHDCETCKGRGLLRGEERYETAEEVGIITDPIPHYDRGRTKVDLDLSSLQKTI